MTFPRALRAREPRAAARTAARVLAVCAAMLGLVATLGPTGPTDTDPAVVWASAVGLCAVAAVFAWMSPERLDRAGAFLASAVVGVTALVLLSIASGSTSTRSQALLALAVLYVGFHLRPAGAYLVTGLAVAAGGAMLFESQPLKSAATDLVFFGTMLTVLGVLLIQAVSAQEHLVAALQRQADIDALTGLATRRVLDEALTTALSTAAGDEGTALVLVDVDEFKSINDEHGHLAGDDALVHLSALVKRHIRASDAVVGRLGGDELAVLLPDCTREVAVTRAEQLLEAVRSEPLLLPDGTLFGLSVSLGVAHVDDRAGDLRGLYAAADGALYEAKRAGRGRVAVAG